MVGFAMGDDRQSPVGLMIALRRIAPASRSNLPRMSRPRRATTTGSRADRSPARLVLPDQLSGRQMPSGAEPGRYVVIESREWLSRRPYHRQRVASILLNLRAFVAEVRDVGGHVDHLRTDGSMREALAELLEREHLLEVEAWHPAEREMRCEFAPFVEAGRLRWLEHPLWLTSRAEFDASIGKAGPRMDAFYRRVRKRTGILMDDEGRPVGGKLSFDAENREAWHGVPAAPDPPRFAETPLRREVGEEIAGRFASHPGELDLQALPATAEDAGRVWAWAKAACLPHFGPFEDAMSVRSRGLFHTRISPLLNLGRLDPHEVLRDVVAMEELPLPSREGFIRQLIGWREFVRHVHDATDGLRDLGGASQPETSRPGDGGYAAWAGREWTVSDAPTGVGAGSDANALSQRIGVPPAFWGRESGLACLDRVVEDVWAESWSHHITRLMVLGNLANLLDVSPRDLADWFWIAYLDAWEWVVEPNVMGMATWALGGFMTTKPYVAGSAYIDRMSDYCGGCRFHPKKTCPITRLYWAFLARHEPALRGNHRLGVVLQAMRKRSEADRRRDADTFSRVQQLLVEGRPLPVDVVGSAPSDSRGR
jgi:deoxyribodipyrimidine photolyase-related protein